MIFLWGGPLEHLTLTAGKSTMQLRHSLCYAENSAIWILGQHTSLAFRYASVNIAKQQEQQQR
jgi:hypothetical protein